METVGIICEYNPFHKGHLRQLRIAREKGGGDRAILCLMSGNYVQRGAPAIFSKAIRAEAALRCGADLVLELPLTVALSSAEAFADGGVSILSRLGCDRLCFGTESDDLDPLQRTAQANLDPRFDELLRRELEGGCSYPAARQRALEQMGAGQGLRTPNDILAVEYLKALLRQNSPMEPLPIQRPDTYHDQKIHPEAPSASAIRKSLSSGGQGGAWLQAVPENLWKLFLRAPRHNWQAGERAVLALLRTGPEELFQALPFGSEGLWSKLMKASRSCASVEEIIEGVKSKRYPRTRIQRMLLCAALGLSKRDLETAPPYARILAFNEIGRGLIRQMRDRFPLINAGACPQALDYYAMECRAADLYDLFSCSGPRAAGEEQRLRVVSLAQARP